MMSTIVHSLALRCLVIFCAICVVGCGGGSGGRDSAGNVDIPIGGVPGSSNWVKGQFLPASDFEGKCVSPRSGIDPTTGGSYTEVQGTRLDENNWLRSMSNELYLWYNEIADQDPAGFDDSLEYFAELKTFALTASGQEKDRFHFTLPTEEWLDLTESGISVGYGFQWALLSAVPPRRAVIAYLDTESAEGLPDYIMRGTELLSVDGVNVVNSDDIDTLNRGMWPASAGEQHVFRLLPPGATDPVTVTLTAKVVTSDPVQSVKSIQTDSGRKVGYMLFNDHIATAEGELIRAVSDLRGEGVEDLVLDLRYNGGGYLDIASELAYMVAGDSTSGRTFELSRFNDQHPNINPVTNRQLLPTPFHNTSRGFGAVQSGMTLPSLNLQRLFVLTGEGTCSASEAIINGLRGIDVEVVQIGDTTCGKPYGFYPLDNCGTTYFTIQFSGVNAKGFGDYSDGFVPGGSHQAEAHLPGCQLGDDFTHFLGDTNEARFAAALNYIDTGSCGDIPVNAFSPSPARERLSGVYARVPKDIARSNRIMVR
ncbi:S41 family peptidase [Microbulbifer sp. 2205BS26-8]|uniref:S41 family peptidase n=1 Tax=Microbulbifer sp. 2205BS26-8 TaxID=3064386 RepID=UPI00273FA701|nr:S41 family peptidase [Microbulbifer sp. 2205BS26-8]MDP5209590.1 S41 family peptidase [Microbulbifer sp. 2205BS26-8]